MKRKVAIAWLKHWPVIALALGCLIVGFILGTFIFWKPWHLPPNWGDIPTWLAVVIATAGGFTALLQLRSQQEALQRDAFDRRRVQVARVFIGADRDPGRQVRSYVKNASDFAIYEAVLWYLNSDGLLADQYNPDYLGTILPGEDPYGTRYFGSKEARSRTVLTFRDANSVYWIRMPRGFFDEEPTSATRESVRARLRALPPGTLAAGAEQRGSGGARGSVDGPDGGGGTGDSSGTGSTGTGNGPGGGESGT